MSAPDSSMGNEMWKFFQIKKVKIASEIKRTYPFLHILRDKQIILEEDFKEWLKKIDSNPKTINEVIYNVLHSIKSESALQEIFCEEILNAYPNLKPIYQEFKNMPQSADTSCPSERKSNEEHNSEKNNPRISIKKKQMAVAARIKKYYQRQSISKRKMTDLPKEQKKKNLPVHCGGKKGFLCKKKLAAGISEKSIQISDGRWLTPNEFQAEGGREKYKNWKRSIHCGKFTLEKLIQMKHLEAPPRSRRRQNKPENPLCSVCSSGENLIRCPKCPKSFHDSCHVPDVPKKKGKNWMCTFCNKKKICSKTSSKRQEEKALVLLMRCKPTLMCQYLLLEIWCETRRTVPEDENMFTELKEVKEKLHQKQYEKVENFKRHMCQIFTNFQERNKPCKAINCTWRTEAERSSLPKGMSEFMPQGKEIAVKGRKLQIKFEKSFHKVFSIK